MIIELKSLDEVLTQLIVKEESLGPVVHCPEQVEVEFAIKEEHPSSVNTLMVILEFPSGDITK